MLLSSCNKESVTASNTKVLSRGMDCGDTFLIQFNDGVAGVPANNYDNIFYADNLPEAFKVENTTIHVSFRVPTDSETMACTAQGIAYPHIYILQAE